jgi:outer membrane protein assembly factor BamD (BamD/ComL family)
MKLLRLICGMLLCGTGHMLKKDYLRGITFFITFICCFFIIFMGINQSGILPFIFAVSGACLSLFIWIYSLIDLSSNNEMKKKKAKINEELNDIYTQGIAHYLKQDYDKAIEVFQSILKKNKKDTDALFQLAKSYLKQGNKKMAKKIFKKFNSFETYAKWKEEVKLLLEKLKKKEK